MAEIERLKENMDAWVKQVKRDLTELDNMVPTVCENTDNIQHNYELIYELKDEIEELKQEINSLKLIQIVSLKSRIEQQKQLSY